MAKIITNAEEKEQSEYLRNINQNEGLRLVEYLQSQNFPYFNNFSPKEQLLYMKMSLLAKHTQLVIHIHKIELYAV